MIRTLALFIRLLPHALDPAAYPVDTELCVSAALDVASVVAAEEPLPFASDPELSTAKLLLRWSFHESGLRSTGADGETLVGIGGALGAMQILPSTAAMFGTTKEKLANRRESYRVGLLVFRAGLERCGSLRGALRSYASGSCSQADALVAERCALAGVGCGV